MRITEVSPMRTTLNLDEVLIRDLMAATGAKTKTEAIHRALSDFVSRQKRSRLKALSGKIHLKLDWRQLEEEEMKAQAEREALWHDHR
jgi:Arc/MetJ family transcription regulator